MEKIIEHLESIPRNEELESILQFLKDQKFIKQHLRNGGGFDELEAMGFKFGKVDLSNLTERRSEKV